MSPGAGVALHLLYTRVSHNQNIGQKHPLLTQLKKKRSTKLLMLLDAHCEIVRPSLDACVLHPCWHMLTRMLKENEGQGADACLNISNYCELFGQIIRGVMCSQGCKTARHVNDTLI